MNFIYYVMHTSTRAAITRLQTQGPRFMVRHESDVGAQVMEEGERLSKKQLAQENRIKELRASADELRGAAARAEAAAAAERQKVRAAAPSPHRTLRRGTRSISGSGRW